MCADDIAVIFESKVVTARKPYWCYECPKRIMPGEKYVCNSGLFPEGGWQSFRVCEPCEQLRDWLSDGGCVPAFGDINNYDWQDAPRSMFSHERLQMREEQILEELPYMPFNPVIIDGFRVRERNPLLIPQKYWKTLADSQLFASYMEKRYSRLAKDQQQFNHYLHMMRDADLDPRTRQYIQEQLNGDHQRYLYDTRRLTA